MTINPSNDLVDMGGKTHTVTMASGVVKDAESVASLALSGGGYYFQVADATAPSLVSTNPAHNIGGGNAALYVYHNAPVVLTFSEAVQASTGNLVFNPSGGNDPNPTALIDVKSPQLTFNDNVVTVRPWEGLLDAGDKVMIVTMAAGVLKDAVGNNLPAISALQLHFNVLDNTNPTATGYSPPRYSWDQSKNSDVVITFSEDCQAGTGNVILTPSGGNGANTPVTIDVGGGQVSFADYSAGTSTYSRMTVNPTNPLPDMGTKLYTVTMGAGVVKDKKNLPYAGLAGTAYIFHVADSTAPTVATYLPAQAATGVSRGTNVVLTFDEDVQSGAGNITLTPSAGNGIDIPVTFAASSGQVIWAGNTATINPVELLLDRGNKKYTVTMPAGAVQDLTGNPFAGITGTTYEFTMVDTSPPRVTVAMPPHPGGYFPTQNGMVVAKGQNIELTFDEDVVATAQNIVLTPRTGAPVSLAANDAQVGVAGAKVTINPTNDLVATGMAYSLTMASGTFTDAIPNSYAGLLGLTYSFTVADTDPPTVTTYKPANAATSQRKTSDLKLTFSEGVKAGSGFIVITPSGGNSLNTAISINVSDTSQVTFNMEYVTINPSVAMLDHGGKTQTVTMGSGVVTDLEGTPHAGLTGTAYSFAVIDSSGPLVNQYAPAQAATGVASSTNVTLTFNENIQAGAGSVILQSTLGTGPDRTYNFDVTGPEVTIVGQVLTINPASRLIDTGGKVYTLLMNVGVIKDTLHNPHAGVFGTTYQFTMQDTTPPAVAHYFPAQGASGILKSVNLVLTFSEAVQAGSGIVKLTPSGGNGMNNPREYSVNGAQVTFSGNKVTIDPDMDLVDTGNKLYYVEISNETLLDAAGNHFGGLRNDTFGFTLRDTTVPYITAYNPVQYAAQISKSTDVIITFNEYVQAGSGSIVFTPAGGNGALLPVLINVSTSQVTFSQNVMTINPDTDMIDTGDRLYTVTMVTGVVKDVACLYCVGQDYSNPFGGIAGTDYQFTVADSTAPTVLTYYPVQEATQQPKGVNIVLAFSEHVQAATGSITLAPQGGNGVNTATVISASDSQVTIAGDQVTINPAVDLLDTGGKTYTVTMGNSALKDAKGLPYVGIQGSMYRFHVKDSTIPTISGYYPAQGATGQIKAVNIEISFSEYIEAGVGWIYLTPSLGNGVNTVTALNVSDSTQVSITPGKLTLNPTNDLLDKGGKTYTVTMAAGVIMGQGGNPFPGVSGTTYQFGISDGTAPLVLNRVPLHASSNNSKATDIVLNFDEAVQAAVGFVTLTPSGGVPISINVTSSEINFNDNIMTVNPAAYLSDAGDKLYTITINSGAITDSVGNIYSGVIGKSYQFTVTQARKPSAVSQLNVTATSQNSLQLSWVRPFNGYSPLLTYTLYTWRELCGLDTCSGGVTGAWDGGRLIDGGTWSRGYAAEPHSGTRTSLALSDVPTLQTLKFKLVSRNDIGDSEMGVTAQATMKMCSNVGVVAGTTTWNCLL